MSLVLFFADDGRLWMWGDNWRGQLGHGDTQILYTPTVVESLVGKRVVQVALGSRHTIVMTGAVCVSMSSLFIAVLSLSLSLVQMAASCMRLGSTMRDNSALATLWTGAHQHESHC